MDKSLTYRVVLDIAQARTEAERLRRLFQDLHRAGTPAQAQAEAAFVASQRRQMAAVQAATRDRLSAAQNEAQERVGLASRAVERAISEERRLTEAVRTEARARSHAASAPVSRPVGAPPLAGGLGNLGGIIGGGIIGGATALLSAQAAQQAADFMRLGNEVRRARESFMVLAGGAKNAEDRIAAVQRAAGGAVTELQAIAIGNQAAALGLAKTTTEFENLTKAARLITLVSPTVKDLNAALTELSLFAANEQSFARADQLGLTASEVRGRMADVQGRDPEMDASQAKLVASIELLNEKFGGLTQGAAGAISGLDNLQRALADARASAAVGFQGSAAGQGIDRLMTDIAQGIDLVSGNADQLRYTVDLLGRSIETLSKVEATPLFGRDTSQERAELEQLIIAIENLRAAATAGIPEADEYAARLNSIGREASHSREVTEKQSQALNEIARWFSQATDGGNLFADAQRHIAAAAPGAVAGIDGVTAAVARYNHVIAQGQVFQFQPGRGFQNMGPVQGPLLEKDQPARFVNPTQRVPTLEEWNRAIGTAVASIGKDAEENARRAAAEQARAAKRAETEWAKAARQTERAFQQVAQQLESDLRGAPGLFGTSSVTQEQMDMAALGVPQNFADDYLRRLRDEVLNGKDWADVSIEDAARRAGIDPNLPAEVILKQFEEAWRNSSLFADPENLELINQEAVQEQLDLQERIREGQKNILEFFGATVDGVTAGLPTQGGSPGLPLAGGRVGPGLLAGEEGEAAIQRLAVTELFLSDEAKSITGGKLTITELALAATAVDKLISEIATQMAAKGEMIKGQGTGIAMLHEQGYTGYEWTKIGASALGGVGLELQAKQESFKGQGAGIAMLHEQGYTGHEWGDMAGDLLGGLGLQLQTAQESFKGQGGGIAMLHEQGYLAHTWADMAGPTIQELTKQFVTEENTALVKGIGSGIASIIDVGMIGHDFAGAATSALLSLRRGFATEDNLNIMTGMGSAIMVFVREGMLTEVNQPGWGQVIFDAVVGAVMDGASASLEE